MKLQTLIADLEIIETIGKQEMNVHRIDFDSRKVKKGSLFVAVAGTVVDGHDFIEKAIGKGAVAIVCENWPQALNEQTTYIKVKNSAKALAILASGFFGRPSGNLKLIGVTGTNGKTTIVNLLFDLFQKLGYKCGMLSTIENRINDRVFNATHTTPDSVAINALLAEMVESGCDYAFMEVSSHAIAQHRIAGLRFAGGIFTNLTHDHLDYHLTFKAYIDVKKAFFDGLPKGAFALVNIDDKHGMVMVQNTKASVFTYGLKRMADFKARILDDSLTGLHLEIDKQEVYVRLIGTFNASNIMSVYGTAVLLEQDKVEALTWISALKAAEGRFDYLISSQQKIAGIVDYAHTPDALEKVLKTLQALRKGSSKIITVTGCGGDRDRTKRPKMAAVASVMSDTAILTTDNPRSESPDAIIQEMATGIPLREVQKVLLITDRKQAIKTACSIAGSGDIILIAGKGHEKYQEIKGKRYPFDDKAILMEAFKNL